MRRKEWSAEELEELKREFEASDQTVLGFSQDFARKWDRSIESVRAQLRNGVREGTIERPPVSRAPARVLVLDIETLPAVMYSWRLYEPVLSHENIIKDTVLLSIAAKWLYDRRIMAFALTPTEALERDDSRLANEAWKMLNEAEVVIAHNGRKFDLPKLNARFFGHRMRPPGHYRIIDTKADLKGLGLTSRSQDYIARYRGAKRKLHTDFKLWIDCDNGDKRAIQEMRKYNEHDVMMLEEMYVAVRPWLRNHPNLAVFEDLSGDRCPACKSRTHITKGRWSTTYNLYETWRCSKCGAVGRGRASVQ